MVSWADRIAYVCHDWEDAVLTGIVTPTMLPAEVRERCGDRRGQQLGSFIDALVATVLRCGRIAMDSSDGRGPGGVPRLQLRARLPSPGLRRRRASR